jgi:hypothetical protein
MVKPAAAANSQWLWIELLFCDYDSAFSFDFGGGLLSGAGLK